MTFCVGVGCSNIGLVAADTRCKTEDGLISDDGELRFKNPSGGRSLVLPSQYRKIRRLDGGWVTGSGVFQWLALMFRELESRPWHGLEDGARAIYDLKSRELAAFEARYPQAVPEILNHTRIILVERVESGEYQCHALNARGQGARDISVVCGSPPEMPEENAQELMRSYEAEFSDGAFMHGFYNMLRRTARLIQDAHDTCGPVGSVSDVVEIGLSRRTRSGRELTQHIAPTPCGAIIDARDRDLQAALQDV